MIHCYYDCLFHHAVTFTGATATTGAAATATATATATFQYPSCYVSIWRMYVCENLALLLLWMDEKAIMYTFCGS